MIGGNDLVYDAWDSVLSRWEIRNPLINGLVIGVLTTILSYQATAVIFNISLGFKPRRVALTSDLQTLLLVHHSSPLAVAETISRNDFLTCRRFVLKKGSFTPLSRDPGESKKQELLKLLLLLAIAPLINIAAISLTFEKSHVLTFRQARFGGIRVGLNEDSTVLEDASPLTDHCALVPVKLARGEESLARFILCQFTTQEKSPTLPAEDEIKIIVSQMKNTTVLVQLSLGSSFVSFSVHAIVDHNDSIFFLPHDITNRTAHALANHGMSLLAHECQMTGIIGTLDVTEQEAKNFPLAPVPIVAKNMTCITPPQEVEVALGKVSVPFLKQLTFVKSDLLLVAAREEHSNVSILSASTFSNAEDFKFLQRRRRNLSLLWLLISTASVTAIRALTAVFLHNDVDMGLEMIMKKRFSFGCCDSILWCDGSIVDFNTEEAPGQVSFNDGESAGEEFEQAKIEPCIEVSDHRHADNERH